jgi:hypothetical protein
LGRCKIEYFYRTDQKVLIVVLGPVPESKHQIRQLDQKAFSLSVCCNPAETLKAELIASLPKAPQHVLTSSFRHHIIDYDVTPAATHCRVPIAYIGSETPAADLVQFQNLTPQLITAKTLGSGHYSPVFVPRTNAPLYQLL